MSQLTELEKQFNAITGHKESFFVVFPSVMLLRIQCTDAKKHIYKQPV